MAARRYVTLEDHTAGAPQLHGTASRLIRYFLNVVSVVVGNQATHCNPPEISSAVMLGRKKSNEKNA